ncbi:MAG: glycosyltransferase family 4 protein [Saprospiraceae bacterium]|nr:glycosyltransferase family 4 protein [Saprospiraceae bacterium]
MPTIRLFFRKRRTDVKFVSIENSFATMLAAFPNSSKYNLVKFESNFDSIGWGNRWRAIQEVRQHKADVNHVTGDVHFLVFGLPKSRTILTIHDCGFLQNKNPLQKWVLWLIWLRLPIARCRIVTTVSEATKRDILALVPCKPEKIVVVPTVINALFERREKIFNKKKPVILHIGITENKNLKRHIVALRGLSCMLHIVGKISDDILLLLKTIKLRLKTV